MVTADDALHLTPREVAQVEAALDDPDDGTDGVRCGCGRFVPCRRDHGLTRAELLAAAAIVAAEADERGMRHWTDLADRLTAEAARRAAERIEAAS